MIPRKKKMTNITTPSRAKIPKNRQKLPVTSCQDRVIAAIEFFRSSTTIGKVRLSMIPSQVPSGSEIKNPQPCSNSSGTIQTIKMTSQ